MKSGKLIFFIFLFFFLTASQVFATGAGITYNGRILNPNGDPVQGNSVQFKLQIKTPGNENCLMYEEVQVKDMSGSDGVFTLTINDGSGTRLDSAAYGLDQIFANRGTFSFPTNYCVSGNSYAPNPSDGRKLQVYFNDGTIPAGEWEPSPAMAINFIPSAIEAMQVGGYKKEQLLKLADGVSTSGSELDATKWTNLQALLAGSSSQYVTPGSATFTAAPSWNGTPSVGTDLVNKTYVDAQVAAGLPDVGTPGTYGKVTTDTKGRVTSGAALVEADIPTLSTAGKVSGAAITTGTLGGNAAINTTGNLVTTGTVSGQTLSATQLRVYNGSNYLQFTSPTLAGITNFILPAGDSTGTQYLRSDGAGNLSWGSPGSGSGTVNSGTANQLAYYAGAGTAVSGLSTANNGVLVTSGAGAPSISSTLPSAVQTNITGLGTITSGTWNGTAIAPQYGGTGINASSAANGTLTIGNGSGFTLANLTQAANQGVTITNGSGSIALGTAQDIRTTASPTFAGMILNNVATNLTQSVSVGTSYGITWPGSVASTAGSVLTSTTGGLLSWTAAVPAANGGTGQSSYTIGDLLYASTSSALSRLPASTSGYVLTSNGAGTAPSWQAAAGGGAISALTAAASTNSIDNTNYAQTWNWSTATTENPMTLTANALTTGSLLSVSTSNGSLNSTNGLLNVANTGASTGGVLARLQSNSTAGSGLTVLANGNVGIGTTAPQNLLHIDKNINGGSMLSVTNSNAGNTAFSMLGVGSAIAGVTYGEFSYCGSGFSPGGIYQARRTTLIGNDTGGLGLGALNATGNMTFFTGGITNERMRIDSSGNVGVGTASPTSRLHVVGENGTSGAAPSTMNVVGGTGGTNGKGGNISIAAGQGTGTGAGGDLTISAGGGGTAGFGSRGNVLINAGDTGGDTQGTVTIRGGYYSSLSGGQLLLTGGHSVNGSGGATLSTPNGNGIAGGSGSIAITTGNSAMSASAGNITLTAGNGNGTGSGGTINLTGGGGGSTNVNGSNVVLNGGAKGGTGADGNIILANTRGKVGIGTSSPSGILEVFASGSGRTAGPIRVVDKDVTIGILSSTVGDHSGFSVVDRVGNPIFVTDTMGARVGINTNAPGNTFEVMGATAVGIRINSGAGAKWDFNSNYAVNNNLTLTPTVGGGNFIISGGNVGIGVTGPSTKLQVAGIISPDADATYDLGTSSLRFKDIYASNNVIQTSDARMKRDIMESDLGLDFITKLRPVSYYWRQGADQNLHYGVIAQETAQALSEAKQTSGRPREVDNVIVAHDEKTDRYGVRYTELIAPLIKATQELFARLLGVEENVKTLLNENASKDQKIRDLELRIERLERALTSSSSEIKNTK